MSYTNKLVEVDYTTYATKRIPKRLRLDIFIAEKVPLDIQHIRNRLVRAVPVHVEYMAESRGRAGVAIRTSRLTVEIEGLVSIMPPTS